MYISYLMSIESLFYASFVHMRGFKLTAHWNNAKSKLNDIIISISRIKRNIKNSDTWHISYLNLLQKKIFSIPYEMLSVMWRVKQRIKRIKCGQNLLSKKNKIK